MKSKERPLTWTRTLYLFVALVLVSLALILLSQGRQLQSVEGVASQVFTPVQQAVHNATSSVGGWIETLGHMKDIEDENKKLRVALDQLTAENARIQQLERDNANLRSLLKFQSDRPDIKGIQANVIGGDPSSTMEILTIDAGTQDGITPGMAVLSTGGILVGQIKDAKVNRATVLLITDIASSVAVATQNRDRKSVV